MGAAAHELAETDVHQLYNYNAHGNIILNFGLHWLTHSISAIIELDKQEYLLITKLGNCWYNY